MEDDSRGKGKLFVDIFFFFTYSLRTFTHAVRVLYVLVKTAHVRFLQDLTGDNLKDSTEHITIASEAILSLAKAEGTYQTDQFQYVI